MPRISKQSYSLILTTLCALFALPGVSFASPTVTETTISWPDNGWYQVQRADTYESICNGGRSCDVVPGNYVVINHSTGERFEVVVESSTTPNTTISVNGLTISWPDDGWYQVQRTDTYESVCNGGRECTVTAGKYVVINHSNDVREEVVVGEPAEPENPGPNGSAIKVSADNVISWPDDGWYEVQLASTYESICTGGQNCAVPSGLYNVINHTTGERFDGIEVGDAPPTPPPSSPRPMAELSKTNSIRADGRWGDGRSSPWQFNTQWFDTNGDSLFIDSQVQGPPGEPNTPRQSATTSGGAQWGANYTDTHLQIVILGPKDYAGFAYPSASIFLDTDNSQGAEFDGVNDYHFIIPVNSRDGERWSNNISSEADGYFLYGDQSAYLDPSAIQFGTCSCGGRNTIWEINIDLAAANIPVNKAFGFDVRLSWGFRKAGSEETVEYSFGWADGANADSAKPANMGTLKLLPE